MDLQNAGKIDEKQGVAEMLLFGGIGSKIDSDRFANELNYLAKNFKTVIVRINSEGGHIIQGLSIFNAMLGAEAHIIARIEGIAASMAGVIATAADEIQMNDFARLMVHNPSYANNAKITAKQRNTLGVFKAMLTEIFTRRNITADNINNAMNIETWYTATEAKTAGLIDSIIDTGRVKDVQNVLNFDLVAELKSEDFKQFIENDILNNNNMEKITKSLGLAEDASNEEILNAIEVLNTEKAELVSTNDELVNELQVFAEQKEQAQKDEAASLVNNAIESGHFKEDQRDELSNLANDNYDTFKAMVNALQPIEEVTSLSAVIQNNASQVVNEVQEDGSHIADLAKRFDWLRRNNEGELRNISENNLDLFNKMFNAFEAVQ